MRIEFCPKCVHPGRSRNTTEGRDDGQEKASKESTEAQGESQAQATDSTTQTAQGIEGAASSDETGSGAEPQEQGCRAQGEGSAASGREGTAETVRRTETGEGTEAGLDELPPCKQCGAKLGYMEELAIAIARALDPERHPERFELCRKCVSAKALRHGRSDCDSVSNVHRAVRIGYAYGRRCLLQLNTGWHGAPSPASPDYKPSRCWAERLACDGWNDGGRYP
jgi:hypothetical protein